MLLINQHKSVSCLAFLHVQDSLICIHQWPQLYPGLDIELDSQMQHLLNLFGRANSAATQLEAAVDERKSVDGGQVAIVRSAMMC